MRRDVPNFDGAQVKGAAFGYELVPCSCYSGPGGIGETQRKSSNFRPNFTLINYRARAAAEKRDVLIPATFVAARNIAIQ